MTDPKRAFQRSRRFGIVGVVVVAVLAAALALAFGQNNANPTAVLIPILGLVFGFVAVLMHLQRRDLDAAAASSQREAIAPAAPVSDPTEATTIALLAELATRPLDREAVAAADERSWEFGRRSISSGAVLMVLIFCAVVPWQLFQFKWSLIVFVPLIVGYAVYLAARVLMPGGAIDQGYDSAAPTLEALGLNEDERPRVRIREHPYGPQPMRHEMVGAVAYSGTRHGRRVSVRIEGAESAVTVGGTVAAFEIRAEGERLHAMDGAPGAVEAVIAPLRSSSYWKGVRVRGGPDGVVVERGSSGGQHWLRDLWLAERLADAAAR